MMRSSLGCFILGFGVVRQVKAHFFHLFDRDSSGLKYSLIVDAIEQGYYKIA